MKILKPLNQILKYLPDAGLGAVVPTDPPYDFPPPHCTIVFNQVALTTLV